MDETVSLLRDRIAKAETKLSRAEKALETARSELSDLQTTLRVLQDLTSEPNAGAPQSGTSVVAERQSIIMSMLGVGVEQAKAPSDLFDFFELLSSEKITIDTFRTTVWRMRNNEVDGWTVRSDGGVYWKERVLSPEEALGIRTAATAVHHVMASNPLPIGARPGPPPIPRKPV